MKACGSVSRFFREPCPYSLSTVKIAAFYAYAKKMLFWNKNIGNLVLF